MLLRILERLIALLFWVVVTAVAFVVATQRTLDVADRPQQLIDRDEVVRTVATFDPTAALAITTAVGLVLLGLAILVMSSIPRRPRTLLHHADERVTFTLDRRGLERRLARTAELDPDVDEAKVRIRRRVKIMVNQVKRSDEQSVRRRVSDRQREELGQLVARNTPKVKVAVHTGGGGSDEAPPDPLPLRSSTE